MMKFKRDFVHFSGQYFQNICPAGNTSCTPCADRKPSCVGQPDGNNAVPGKAWSQDFMTCSKDRTLSTPTCPVGQFDPSKRSCISTINPGNLTTELQVVFCFLQLKVFVLVTDCTLVFFFENYYMHMLLTKKYDQRENSKYHCQLYIIFYFISQLRIIESVF